jgi:hypothetical protein
MPHHETYEIHWNGGIPFTVEDCRKKKCVRLHFQDFSVLLKYRRIFPRVDLDDPDFLGNTVLLEIDFRTYLCFQDHHFLLFKTTDDIEAYFSPVGNSDVPYPFAVGTEKVYLMMEDGCTFRDNSKDRTPFTRYHSDDPEHALQDPYTTFYKHVKNDIKWEKFHHSIETLERLQKRSFSTMIH